MVEPKKSRGHAKRRQPILVDCHGQRLGKPPRGEMQLGALMRLLQSFGEEVFADLSRNPVSGIPYLYFNNEKEAQDFVDVHQKHGSDFPFEHHIKYDKELGTGQLWVKTRSETDDEFCFPLFISVSEIEQVLERKLNPEKATEITQILGEALQERFLDWDNILEGYYERMESEGMFLPVSDTNTHDTNSDPEGPETPSDT